MSTLGCLVVARVCWGEICRRVGVFKKKFDRTVNRITKSRIAYFVYFLDRIHFMSYDLTDMAFAFCELKYRHVYRITHGT